MPAATTRRSPSFTTGLLYTGLLAIAYFLAAHLGSVLTVKPTHFTPFWPPSGMYVAALLLFPMRLWPYLIGGAVLGNITFDLTCGRMIGLSALFTLGNTMEALAGAWLVRKITGGVPRIDRLRDVTALTILSAALSTTISATIGATTIKLFLNGEHYWMTWLAWWSGDALSVMIIAPLVLMLVRPDTRGLFISLLKRSTAIHRLEFTVWTACFLSVLWLMFGYTADHAFMFDYLLWPVLVWAALRFLPVTVVIINAFLGFFGAWMLTTGQPHLVAETAGALAPTVSVQVLIAISVLSSLVIAAVSTERTRVEKSVRRSESRFRELADSIADVFFAMDRNLRCSYWNRASEKITGTPAADAIGKTPAQLFPAAGGSDTERYFRDVLATHTTGVFNMSYPVAGSVRWFEVSAYPTDDGISVFSRDVTARRTMENALHESEEMYHDLVETAQDLIWQCDAQGRYTFLNQAWESVFGYPIEEMMGRKFTDFQKPQQAEHDLQLFGDLLKGATVREHESVHIGRDGRQIHLVFNAKTVRDDTGSVTGTRGTAYDITRRVISENALREQQDRLNSLFVNMTEGVVLHELVVDDQGRPVNYKIIDCNPQYERMLHLKRADVTGRLASDVYGTADVPYLAEFGAVALSGAPARLDTYFAPMKIHFDISIAPWGKNGFATIFTDVTEKKRMEEDLFKAQKLESLGLLAGGIAHDFNNLLGGIFGYMDMALESAENGDNRQTAGHLGKAMSVFERARKLTGQLLTFSKGGAPSRKGGSVDALLRETVQFALSGSNVRSAYEIPATLWPCSFDQHQLAQVIDNMVINAKHAMADGGQLTISAANITLENGAVADLPAGRYVRFTIRDQGTGIPPENLNRIFDPFFSTKQTGSGLGLATSYSIIRKHDGHIMVESELGKGSAFHVYLPASAATTMEAATASTPAVSGNRRRVLIVDDEDYIRDVTAVMLGDLGFATEKTPDGADALTRCREAVQRNARFHAVILDLTIPGGKGGREVIAELKALNPAPIAIAASGYSDDPVIARPIEFGFDASIRKPFSKEELAHVMMTLDARMLKPDNSR